MKQEMRVKFTSNRLIYTDEEKPNQSRMQTKGHWKRKRRILQAGSIEKHVQDEINKPRKKMEIVRASM